jgi:hypothetical protein
VDAVANGLRIPEVSEAHSQKARINPDLRSQVFERVEPFPKQIPAGRINVLDKLSFPRRCHDFSSYPKRYSSQGRRRQGRQEAPHGSNIEKRTISGR